MIWDLGRISIGRIRFHATPRGSQVLLVPVLGESLLEIYVRTQYSI